MRTASFEASPASAWLSSSAFTYVPIPPFQSRSTGAERTARMRLSPSSVAESGSSPSARAASSVSFTDLTPLGTIIPPGESVSRS